MIGRLIQALIVLAVLWAFLVWGLPGVLGVLPTFCDRWHFTTGLCSEEMMERLHRLNDWSERTLRPFSRDARFRDVLAHAYAALGTVEDAVRTGLGNETVDAALRGLDIALDDVEGVLKSEHATEKLRDVPKNAEKLLSDTRSSLKNLRDVLSRTERRAEDVTDAAHKAKNALDALSTVLPEEAENDR